MHTNRSVGACLVILAALSLSCCRAAPLPQTVTLPFDENGGTEVRSSPAGLLSGSLKNGATWTPGIHGSAVTLDPKQKQYIELSTPDVDTRASFTISLWVRLNSLTGTQTIISQNDTPGFIFSLAKNQDNKFALTLIAYAASGNPFVRTITSGFAPTPGLWYQIVAVRDAVSNQIRLSVDGTPLGSAPFGYGWKAVSHTEIGCDSINPGGALFGNFLDGTVDEAQFIPRALSDTQVTARYAADLARFQPKIFTWANPVYFQGRGPHDDVRDPAILRDGGVYYLVYTMWPFRNYTDRDSKLPDMGSSPGVALYASRDLNVWKFKRWLLKSSELPDDCPYKHQFWAPELHKFHGRYYLIFGGSNWLDDKYNIGGHMGYYQFVGVADKIGGPYTHFTALKGPGVDTSLFQDDDGKTYAVWPRNEIHPIDLTQIDRDIVTVGPKLSQAATDDDFRAIGKPVPETIEGPYLIKHADTYYCFFAETYRGPDGFYDTGVATAKHLAGPWTLDPRWRIFPGGHQAIFTGPDERFWTSYKHEQSDVSSWLSIDPISFDTDGRVQVSPSVGPQSIVLNRHTVTP